MASIAELSPAARDRKRQRDAEYRARNRDRIRAYSRDYAATHALRRQAATRAWRLANPERRAAQLRRRYGKLIEGSLTSAAWIQIIESFDERCAYCGRSGRVTLDHIVAVSRGGEHSEDNVAPACSDCNRSKAARDLAEWLDDPRTRATRASCHPRILQRLG